MVQDADRDENSGAIVTALITLCQRLGVRSLAEGVETPGQHAFLKKLGCQEAQGFLYCCPVSAEALTSILQERRLLVPSL
ncbi:Cyclic di-GMP phosphodiesterase Gmr [compost metagenome]